MSSSQNQSVNQAPRMIFIVLLLVLTLFHRLFASQVEWLGNTSPLMAIAFGGGMLLGRRVWWVPALLLIVSDIALALFNGWGLGSHLFFAIPFYVLVALAGAALAGCQNWSAMLLGTLSASLLFYLVANTFAWASSPAYAQSLAGWWQSQTNGLPAYPPSWTFLRNALLADTIWCLLAAPLFFSQALAMPKGAGLNSKHQSVLTS